MPSYFSLAKKKVCSALKPKMTATNVENGSKLVIRGYFCPAIADQHVALKNLNSLEKCTPRSAIFSGLGSAIVFAVGTPL